MSDRDRDRDRNRNQDGDGTDALIIATRALTEIKAHMVTCERNYQSIIRHEASNAESIRRLHDRIDANSEERAKQFEGNRLQNRAILASAILAVLTGALSVGLHFVK